MPPGKQNQPHNPYASAASAYGSNAQKTTSDPRELEARVLLKSAQFMLDLQNDWDNVTSEILAETLKYNRNIWMLFYDTAIEDKDDGRPDTLRNNIINLANYVFKQEIDILSQPAQKKLDILISINRDIAAGLMAGIANAPQEHPASDKKIPPDQGGTDTSA